MTSTVVWFDVETTGVNVVLDRIIEISLVKTTTEGEVISTYESLVNPGGVESRPEALEKHGITQEMLRDAPQFSQIAKEIVDFIGDSDLAGYNALRFDIPILVEELYRAGIPFNHRGRAIIDPFRIMSHYEPRDLGSTYKRLTGRDLEGAHRAQADVEATIEIFAAQRRLYPAMSDNIADIDREVNDLRADQVDLAGKLKFAEVNGKREIVFNFGKWQGVPFRQVYEEDRRYIEWLVDKGEFSQETKIIAKKLLARMQSERLGAIAV